MTVGTPRECRECPDKTLTPPGKKDATGLADLMPGLVPFGRKRDHRTIVGDVRPAESAQLAGTTAREPREPE
jgi:hypothetical protein